MVEYDLLHQNDNNNEKQVFSAHIHSSGQVITWDVESTCSTIGTEARRRGSNRGNNIWFDPLKMYLYLITDHRTYQFISANHKIQDWSSDCLTSILFGQTHDGISPHDERHIAFESSRHEPAWWGLFVVGTLHSVFVHLTVRKFSVVILCVFSQSWGFCISFVENKSIREMICLSARMFYWHIYFLFKMFIKATKNIKINTFQE